MTRVVVVLVVALVVLSVWLNWLVPSGSDGTLGRLVAGALLLVAVVLGAFMTVRALRAAR